MRPTSAGREVLERRRARVTGKYVNYVGEDEPNGSRASTRAGTLRRLMAAKDRRDPDNFFRANHNIPPRRS